MITFTLCLLALIAGYFIYGRFIERVFGPDDRKTPALTKADGVDYIPLPTWKIFMIQFLNIAGLGPIFGAIMGAKFGTASYLWIVLGSIFAGAVHDYLAGMLSLRHDGESLPEIIGRYIYKGVKTMKPWVKVSTCPVGKYKDTSRYPSRGWNAFHTVYQDVQGWLGEGIQDQIYPMLYFRGNHFYPFALDWQEQSNGRQIIPGLGIYFLDPSEGNWTLDEIERQMHFIRAHGLAGEAHYRVKYLMDNTQGLYDALEEDFYTAPALQPAMPWIDNVAPTPPSGLTVETPENGYWKLSWQPATDNDKRNAPMYVIYGSDTYPVDTSNPENILAQRVQGTEYTYAPIRPWTARKYFAVTAIDRCGNESEAIQQQ
jgi:hypothetical protein